MKAAAREDAADREPYPPLLFAPMAALYAVATVGIIAVSIFGDDPALNAVAREQLRKAAAAGVLSDEKALADCLRINEAVAARNALGKDHPPLKAIPCHAHAL